MAILAAFDWRTYTSLTPIQYQKQLRLHAARTRLLATNADVSEVGFAIAAHPEIAA